MTDMDQDQYDDVLANYNDGLLDGGVYGEPAGSGAHSVDPAPSSYEDQIMEVKRRVDRNLSFIRAYVESIQQTNQQEYAQYRQEYEEVVYQYNHDLTEARTYGESSPDDVKASCIKNLLVSLEYTDATVEGMKASGFDPGTIAEATPDIPETTAMVTHSGETAQAGVVTKWWGNVSPGWRTAMKILAVAGALYGGKYAYDRYLAPKVKRRRSRKKPVEEEE